ncbi:MAG: DUF362 domain-containing protein [Spirochaetales bacterium]|nr:DUF362 domain-containing protein [Spirochaetales bacterium]
MHDIALLSYEENESTVKKAIEMVQGFSDLKKDDTVLIKPNIVWGGGLIKGVPRYGFITTCRVIEEVVEALIDYGCDPAKITIGEGSVVSEELKSTTKNGFKWSGMKKLKRLGVQFLDFNEGSFTTVEAQGVKMQIADGFLQSDFVINVPVLKTHFMTGVSLGMKNLKGCLSVPSKKRFHTSKKLKRNIAAMSVAFHERAKPHLTVVDGIYSLECGPSPNGTAARTNLIMAGKDPLSVDLAGTRLLGVPVEEVEYFSEYAQMTGRTLENDQYRVLGENLEEKCLNYNYQVDYDKVFSRVNINGLKMKDAGDTLCTGCVTNIETAFICYTTDVQNLNLTQKHEICAASALQPEEDSEVVFLFGNCACKRNKELLTQEGGPRTIPVKGCTPNLTNFLYHLYKETLPRGKFLRTYTLRIIKTLGTALGIYQEDLLKKNYTYPEFDKKHFR